MTVEESKVILRILKPTTKENWLTNGEVYSQVVYLGKEEPASNWHEITLEEYATATAEELEHHSGGE